MNIFETIKSVTSRQEPFHSQYLADALSSSTQGDRSLFREVWRLVANPDWEIPDDAVVKAEQEINLGGTQGRVDIVIISEEPEKRVVGIEVKTVDASVKEGQLRAYLEGLCRKFEEHEVQMAYLTPFNRKRAGDVADSLRSVREFDEFVRRFPCARHVSWLDIADISWDGNEIWEQHRKFVRCEISTATKLRSIQGGDRQFDIFFGEQSANQFREELAAVGIVFDEDGARIDLASSYISGDLSSFSKSLVRALETLLKEGENVSANARRQDLFGGDLRCRFLDSEYREIHNALFGFANQRRHVWIQGNDNYAVRVAHKNHSGGVSLIRTSGPGVLLTDQRR